MPGKPARYVGSFTAANGLELRFDSTVVADERGFTTDTLLDVGGTQERFVYDASDPKAPIAKLANLEAKGYPEGASEALADLAEVLENLYPPQDVTREPVPENYVYPDGAEKTPVLPNWLAVRDLSRILNRWTLVGKHANDWDGPDFECEMEKGACKIVMPPTSNQPNPECGAGPTDDGFTQINCCGSSLGMLSTFHTAEHDAEHCNAMVNDQCGRFVEKDVSGQSQLYCTGRCGILRQVSSAPMMVCGPLLTGRVSSQDCLDADLCLFNHMANPGPGVGFCQNEVAQSVDDNIKTYGNDALWVVISFFDVLNGNLVNVVPECGIADPGANSGPAVRL